jgi:ribosomal protein L37AE/L43A
MTSKYKHFCRECGEPIRTARYALGYKLCLLCGEEAAHQVKHTIVPSHKSNYIVVTDMDDLKDLNPKYIRSAR